MKTITLKTVLLALTMLLGTTLKAQTFQATYTYDANGNRVTATVST